MVIAYGNASARDSHVRSSVTGTRSPSSPWNAAAGSGSTTPVAVLVTRKVRIGSGHEIATAVPPADRSSAASPSGHGSSCSTVSTSGRSAPTSAIHHHDFPRFGYSPRRT